MTRCHLGLLGFVLCAAAIAEAGLYQDIFQGLDYLVTPSGSPVSTSSDGTRFNGARSGRLRIVPNGVVGKGYRLEFDRTFGVDSTGRDEVFRFGALGDLTVQGSLQATAGYTRLGDKAFRGESEFTASNLQYNLRTTLGAQDAQLTGTLNVSNQIQVNALGFYTLRLDVSNSDSQLTLTGLAARDAKSTNFDVGPINISGNIYYDGTLALLTGLGFDTTGLESLFPSSPINRIDEAIRDQLQASAVVAGESVTADIAPLLLSTVLNQDQIAAEQLMQSLAANADNLPTVSASESRSINVPEPGTLILVGLGTAALWHQRRR